MKKTLNRINEFVDKHPVATAVITYGTFATACIGIGIHQTMKRTEEYMKVLEESGADIALSDRTVDMLTQGDEVQLNLPSGVRISMNVIPEN